MKKQVNKWRRRAVSIVVTVISWCLTVVVVTVPDGAGSGMIMMQPLAVFQVLVGGCTAAVVVRQIHHFDQEGVRHHLIAFGIFGGLVLLASYVFAYPMRLGSWAMTLTPLAWSFLHLSFGHPAPSWYHYPLMSNISHR